MVIKLTKVQADILRHRLEVPDAVSECLCDDTMDTWHPEDVEACCADILKAVTDVEFCDFNIVRRFGSGMVKEILADCIDGSTYLGCAIGNVSDQKINGVIKAGDNLADKVSEYIERKVEFPTG